MNFVKVSAFLVTMVFSLGTQAGVNLKNGNFYISYTDIVVPGGGKKLEITRTYNSKTTKIGWFGFGWGSEFETRLEVSSDGSIIIHEHGTGAQTRFSPKTPIDAVAASTKMVEEIRKKTSLSDKAAQDLINKLATNSELRHSYSIKFNIQQPVAPGTVLYSGDRGPQELHVNVDGYRRVFEEGKTDFFDKMGRLIKVSDKTGYFVAFTYKDKTLESIKDSHGKQVFFSWYSTGLVKELWSAGDKKATFRYEDTDLVYSKDVGSNEYVYGYDKAHNLIKITYSDKSEFKIAYDPKTFHAIEIVERSGESTKYKYESNPSNPENHYWTIVSKTSFDGKPLNNRYEYENKITVDGTRYTYRLLTEISGVKTETIYSENSLPLKIARGNLVTNFEYNKRGQLTKKNSTNGEFVILEYNEKINKVTKVTNNDGATTFEYDAKENLVKAADSKGKIVFLIYDTKGKISKLVDQVPKSDPKVLSFRYNSMGKPVEIEMEKVGKINVAYDNYGGIKKVESSAGHKMALQVTQSFQNLLSIVKPAGVDLNI